MKPQNPTITPQYHTEPHFTSPQRNSTRLYNTLPRQHMTSLYFTITASHATSPKQCFTSPNFTLLYRYRTRRHRTPHYRYYTVPYQTSPKLHLPILGCAMIYIISNHLLLLLHIQEELLFYTNKRPYYLNHAKNQDHYFYPYQEVSLMLLD